VAARRLQLGTTKRSSVDKGVVRRRKRSGSGQGSGQEGIDKSGDDAESPGTSAAGMRLTRAASAGQGLSGQGLASIQRQLEELQACAPWPDPEK
jgi:hypothetical protein